MKITPLNEGKFKVDHTKEFIVYQEGISTKGTIVIDIVPFLVQIENYNILIDSGLGLRNEQTGEYIIEENLKQNGLDCHNIDIVLLSHLHKDHISGVFKTEYGEITPRFPNAKHIISKEEMEYALRNPNFYPQIMIEVIEHKLNVDFISGSKNYNHFISYEHSGGHCPFHQVFHLQSGDNRLFYGGDVLPQPEQALKKIKAKYDFEPELSMNLRTKFANNMAIQNSIGLFYHSSSSPLCKFKIINAKLTIERITTSVLDLGE